MQVIFKYFKNAILAFRRSFKDEIFKDYKRELWEKKCFLLSNMETGQA
jgi:hypothetical protein